MKTLEEKVLIAVKEKGLVDMFYYSIRESKKFSEIVINYSFILQFLRVVGWALIIVVGGDFFVNYDSLGARLYLDGGTFTVGILIFLVCFFIKIKRSRKIKKLRDTDWSLFLLEKADELLKKCSNNMKENFEEFFQFGTKLTDLVQLAYSFPILNRYKTKILEITNEFLKIFKSLGQDPFSNLKSLETKETEEILRNFFYKWKRYEKQISGADFLVEKTRETLENFYKNEMEQVRKKHEEEIKKHAEKIKSLAD